jgi:hypothetical protein
VRLDSSLNVVRRVGCFQFVTQEVIQSRDFNESESRQSDHTDIIETDSIANATIVGYNLMDVFIAFVRCFHLENACK